MSWILLALSVPFFYIIGLVAFIKWLSNGGKSAAEVARSQVAQQLRAWANTHDRSKTARDYVFEVADSLASPEPKITPGVMANGHLVTAATTTPAKSSLNSQFWSKDLNQGLHSLDNINLLLYLGAFLVVVSAGIFVGYNFEALSGGFKTGFLALFALIFYGTGLSLYKMASKLRPAGTTFTAIGLVLAPLVGVAAYNFVFLGANGGVIWFVTSLIILGLYMLTLAITRQTYLAYLMAFTVLSLFESGVSLIHAPVYWFGWALALGAIVLLSISRLKGVWQDAAGSLEITANLFLPVAVLLSLILTADDALGLRHASITLALGGIFYAFMAAIKMHVKAGETYFVAAMLLFPAAILVGLWDATPRSGLTISIIELTIIYQLASRFLGRRRLPGQWYDLAGMTTGLLAIVPPLLAWHDPWLLMLSLVITMGMNTELALRLRNSGLALITVLSLLAIPAVLLKDALQPEATGWQLALAYIVVAFALAYWRTRLRGWTDHGDSVGIVGYVAALGFILVAAASDGAMWLGLFGVLVAGLMYAASYFEQRVEFIYPAAASLYLGVLQLGPWLHLPEGTSSAIAVLLALILDFGGFNLSDAGRAKALRYTGIAGSFLGAGLAVFNETARLTPIAALAAAGVLVWLEGRREKQPVIQEAAGAIVLLAIEWWFQYLGVTNNQMYTIPWAVYFAVLAWRRRNQGHDEYDGWTVASLSFLTLPLAWQALEPSGQLYGLALVFVALGLVVAGMQMRYQLVTWWGTAALIAEVLYQLRDVFYAVPKYLISALLGIALLAAAIILLLRRRT